MLTAIEKQSQNIAQGVHLGKKDEEIGAGDQVISGYMYTGVRVTFYVFR